jgi:uncharacterized integral membrane protein
MGDEPASRERRVSARFVVGVIVVVVLVALIVDNTETVEVGYVFGDVDVSAWVLIVVSALLGAALGWFVSWRARRR